MTDSAVSRSRALRRLLKHARQPETAVLFPPEAVGLVAAAGVTAECNVPEQPCSLRDGYAFNSANIADATGASPVRLKVTQSVRAESTQPLPVVPGEAARVLTGGLVPPCADVVLAEEDVAVDGDLIAVTAPARPGWCVRPAGGEIAFGSPIVQAGEIVTPQSAAVMVRTRVESVPVHPAPGARVYSLGSELCDPCAPEGSCGRFPADNLVLAGELIRSGGGHVAETGVLPDSEQALVDALSGDLPSIVLTTGGTGRSERDFARSGASRAGFEMLFERVDIRPGRNAFGAVRGNTLLFGLPGPPAAVFACFHGLILPVLHYLRGLPELPHPLTAVFDEGIAARPGGDWLVQCRLERRGAQLHAIPLAGKEHPPMLAMGRAHGVAVLAGGDSVLPGGEAEILTTFF